MTDTAPPAKIFNHGFGFGASKTLLSAASRSGEKQAAVAPLAPSYQIAGFEPIAKLPHCEYCNGGGSGYAFAFDAVYCLSLQEQPHGGALIVYESIIDDERRQNAFGLLMSLNMLIETTGGFDYTGSDCQAWMRQAGFSQTRVEPLTDADSMVVAIK